MSLSFERAVNLWTTVGSLFDQFYRALHFLDNLIIREMSFHPGLELHYRSGLSEPGLPHCHDK